MRGTMPDSVTLQVVCKVGHVGLIEDVQPPDDGIVAFIMMCGQCGARADWRRTRPWITHLNARDFNPNPRGTDVH